MVIYTADFMQRIPEGVILSVNCFTINAMSTETPQHFHVLPITQLVTYKTQERAIEVMRQMYEAELRGDRVFIIPEE